MRINWKTFIKIQLKKYNKFGLKNTNRSNNREDAEVEDLFLIIRRDFYY